MNPVLRHDQALEVSRLLEELAQGAREHRFNAAPNPCVGAAILDHEGQVLAVGHHRRYGGAHAEIEAMRVAREAGHDESRWHTLVVTLEPCSSAGKTGPCTSAILAAGFERVVVGALDPDPRHRGKGLELLAEQGIDVQYQPTGPPLERVAPYFLRWTDYERLRRPRPWLIAKWAQTRSGQLTPPEDVGEGRWISSSESQAEVQVMRSSVDAIITGVGTVRADDPRLTVRAPGDLSRAPYRVIFDSELGTPPDARLLQAPAPSESGGRVYILCRAGANPTRHRALLEAGARVHGLRPDAEGRVSLREALAWMWRFDIRRALLEAGPTLTRAFFEAGFVDQMRVYTGDINGGRGDSLAPLLQSLELEGRLHREVGGDGVLEAFPTRIRR